MEVLGGNSLSGVTKATGFSTLLELDETAAGDSDCETDKYGIAEPCPTIGLAVKTDVVGGITFSKLVIEGEARGKLMPRVDTAIVATGVLVCRRVDDVSGDNELADDGSNVNGNVVDVRTEFKLVCGNRGGSSGKL